MITIRPRQKAHELRHVLRHARPLLRDQLVRVLFNRVPLLRARLLTQLLVNQVPHGRADDAGRVGVDGDVVLGVFHGRGLRQAADGPFGGRVVREEGEGFEAYYGGALWLNVSSVRDMFPRRVVRVKGWRAYADDLSGAFGLAIALLD